MKKILTLATAFMIFTCQLALAEEVVLYSSNPSEVIDMISKDFEDATGIKVMPVKMGTGSAMKRIAAESKKPLADVFWSGDVAALDGSKQYFESYVSPQAAVLPEGYTESQNRWSATNSHVMIIMYNRKLVSDEEAPKTWAELFDPKWQGKIAMANPQKSGSAYAQVYGLYKLAGWDGLNKLIDNAKILDSSSLIYKGVAAGEYPVGITMEYAAFRYIAGGDKNVGIIYPNDGAFVAPEGAAIIKGAPHMDAAKKFMDYVMSKDVQDKIFLNYYRRPARPDAAEIKGMPGLGSIPISKSFDPIEANTLKQDLLKEWKMIILSR